MTPLLGLAFFLGGLYACGAIGVDRWRNPRKRTWTFLASTTLVVLISTYQWARWARERPGTIRPWTDWWGYIATNAAIFLLPALIVLGVTATFEQGRVRPALRWLVYAGVATISFCVGLMLAFVLAVVVFHDGP